MTIEHPYENLTGGMWLRGNLHAHTTWSDGSNSPQRVLDAYAGLKYDFMAISDHDILTNDEQYSRLDSHGVVLLPGNEVTSNGPHILHVNAQSRITPGDRKQVLEDIQKEGGFAVINHPNWGEAFDHCTIQQLREWNGYLGMEIYNGLISRLDGSPYAADKWDMLLTTGRRVWGFAHDDSHADCDFGLGWDVVYARERTPEAIVDALANGRFYASTGVVIEEIAVHGNRITIRTMNASRVVALTDGGRRIAESDSPAIEVEAPGNGRYVRFECWGNGEKFAWTQPFFLVD